ncbi:uncharacterized protein PFL1_02279 [Pseudozyma flocculosa PF-1]|uniref:RING-type domain-containing protein n=1 Tax=Pseudozyma flocculosa TaxID=84751 RepID=A0A5C3F954_9BASI|nr:uncharacterized protein PFL1_02279 [Pseudozyma flocculosa PF-1]EPQ30163.1 hypothetical protein PFL1_02279 [Pseudozyma flocculosa PF-1]SPO39911.1 uncharacterized protein PSFLO_05392 [Pseudozyma flocculosa]
MAKQLALQLSLLLWLLFGFSEGSSKVAGRPPSFISRRGWSARRSVPRFLLLLLLLYHVLRLGCLPAWPSTSISLPRWIRVEVGSLASNRSIRVGGSTTGTTASSIPPTPPPGPALPGTAPLTASMPPPLLVLRPVNHYETRSDAPTMASQSNSSRDRPTMPPMPFGSVNGAFGSVPGIVGGPPSAHRKSALSSPAAIGTLSACAFIVVAVITVLIFGLRRARRDPVRYGPRAADPEHPDGPIPPRSRAAGLTRAVLDTFPVTTWGALRASPRKLPEGSVVRRPPSADQRAEVAAGHAVAAVECAELPPNTPAAFGLAHGRTEAAAGSTEHEGQAATGSLCRPPVTLSPDDDRMTTHATTDALAGEQNSSGRSKAWTGNGAHDNDDQNDDQACTAAMVADERTEWCAICTETFSHGDEVRVLPCLGRHHYHVQCIDSWLTISPMCPLCREDLQPHPPPQDAAGTNGTQSIRASVDRTAERTLVEGLR